MLAVTSYLDGPGTEHGEVGLKCSKTVALTSKAVLYTVGGLLVHILISSGLFLQPMLLPCHVVRL